MSTIYRFKKNGFVLASLMTAIGLAGIASAQHISTRIDDRLVRFPDVQPEMINGRVMVPIRGVFEHMKAHVMWSSENRTVTTHHENDTIVLKMDSAYATINGRQVAIDSPATVSGDRVLVPLRFLSESMGAHVEWIENTRTVQIETAQRYAGNEDPGEGMVRINAGAVLPFRFTESMSSKDAVVGDRFTATLDTRDARTSRGMGAGTTLEGHVEAVRAKSGDTPGVLGLAFDRIRTSDGKVHTIHASLIGLDPMSVENENGRLTAKSTAAKNDLKYVGFGAGAGMLVAIVTKGNVLTNALIGGALGFLFDEIRKDPSKARDVTLDAGSTFGVRLNRDMVVRVSPDKR